MLKQLTVAGIIAAGLLRSPAATQPQFDSIQGERARQMLCDLHDALQHHYYDPQYHPSDREIHDGAVFLVAYPSRQAQSHACAAIAGNGPFVIPASSRAARNVILEFTPVGYRNGAGVFAPWRCAISDCYAIIYVWRAS